LPESIEIYRDHAKNRDQFEILAIHDSSVTSLEEMDGKIEKLRELYWKGENLPFPILLDNDRKTETSFGIKAHPSHILIDPDGNVVGDVALKDLEEKLPPLPVATLWSRGLDAQRNVYWSFDKEETVGDFLKILRVQTGCEITIDPKLAESAVLTTESKLPGFIEGYGITLRSIEQIFFSSRGITVHPSEDGTSLVLGHDTRTDQPESHLQQLHNRQILERVGLAQPEPGTGSGGNGAAGSDADNTTVPVADLEIDLLTLREAAHQISRHFDLPVAISSAAIHLADTDVTGVIKNASLASSINEMIDSSGLEVVVRWEVLLIVPKEKRP